VLAEAEERAGADASAPDSVLGADGMRVLTRRFQTLTREHGGHEVAMVLGNLGPDSGTGVAFTRDPATGAPGVYGGYLSEAEGEDVVSRVRNTLTLERFAELDPGSYALLTGFAARLEAHHFPEYLARRVFAVSPFESVDPLPRPRL
jgi:hypothetical protein